MPDIIEIVLPTFFVIFIGYLIGRFTSINIAPVVDINLYVAVPALVFVSLLNRKIVLLDATKVWAAALIIMCGCLSVAWLVFKILRRKHLRPLCSDIHDEYREYPLPHYISGLWGRGISPGYTVLYSQ